MSNTIKKLLISFTTAAALGATAVISESATNIKADSSDIVQTMSTAKYKQYYKNQAKVISNTKTNLKNSTNKNNAQLAVNNYNQSTNQADNSVSVTVSPEKASAVKQYITDYYNGNDTSSDTDKINNNKISRITYTGNTNNDNKKFYVPNSYQDAMEQLSDQDIQEINQTIANAINSIRDQLGISQQVGHVIPNNNLLNVAKQITNRNSLENGQSKYNQTTVNNIASQNNIDSNTLSNTLDYPMGTTNIGIDPSVKTYLDQHPQKVITLAQIKQRLLDNFVMASFNVMGIQDWQLDEIKANGVHDSYFAFWQGQMQSNQGYIANMLYIPNTTNSFTDQNTYNNYGNANLNKTTVDTSQSLDTLKSNLQQAQSALKASQSTYNQNYYQFLLYAKQVGAKTSISGIVKAPSASNPIYQKVEKQLKSQIKSTKKAKKTSHKKKTVKKAHKVNKKKSQEPR